MKGAGVALGARLRRHREGRGISLRAVADTTKIAHPLLEALERGDVSQWPSGIYRAGFIRAYAAAVGLPPDETAREFAETFDPPPPATEPTPAAPAAVTPPSTLRLMLASTRRPTFSPHRARIAALDVSIVLAIALLVSALPAITLWAAIACCGLAYYAGSTIWQGRTAAALWLGRDPAQSAPREVPRIRPVQAPAADAALPLAFDRPADPVEVEVVKVDVERRSGTERRRRPARYDLPRPAQRDESLIGPRGLRSVH